MNERIKELEDRISHLEWQLAQANSMIETLQKLITLKDISHASDSTKKTDPTAEAIQAIIDTPVTGCPLVDASAQAISGGKTRFDPEAEAQYRKALEAMSPEQRQALTCGSWETKLDELTDMSSDNMLDYASDFDQSIHQFAQTPLGSGYKDSDFGPDEAHIDPHQADHEPTHDGYIRGLVSYPPIKQVDGILDDTPKSKLWLPEQKGTNTTNTIDAENYLKNRERRTE